jgi:hypothetical protein
MLECVLAVADREGVPAYLDGFPTAARLYRRHGFVTVDSLEFPLGRQRKGEDTALEVMIREPRRRA